MSHIETRFGVPKALPPLSIRELRGYMTFGCMGLFVLLIGLFPGLRPSPQWALPLAASWLALPVVGLYRFLTRSRREQAPTPAASGTRPQVAAYAIVMIGVGIAFFFWARHLEIPPPVILGTLLIIEGLGGVIVALTDWWRLSQAGMSLGLITGGFLLPLVGKLSVAVPVGGAFLVGSMVSAAVLYWQLRHQPTTD